MKGKLFYAGLFFVLILAACSSETDKRGTFDTRGMKLSGDRITPEVLWSFGRLGNASLSPDGSTLLYTVSYSHIEENRTYTDVYVMSVKGGEPVQLTHTYTNESQVAWRPDGQKITFLSSESGTVQLWEMNADGTARRRISEIPGGITGYQFSPDMQHLVYSKKVKLDKSVVDMYPDLPLTNARIEEDLMYRHWDSWHDYTYSHLFVVPIGNDRMISSGTDIMEGERYNAPMKPFGGMEQVTWTPCGKGLAYTCKKLTGRDYAVSTNSDIYLYELESGETVNLTEGMMGYDKNPKFSPDGSLMLWESMARDGYEADKNRLMVMDLNTGVVRDFSAGFDHDVSGPVWDDSGAFIWFTSNVHATEQIYLLDLNSGSVNRITEGVHNLSGVMQTGESLVATRVSMSAPADLIRIDMRSGSMVNLTNINSGLLEQLEMGHVEERWVTTTDNKQMLVWVIYPPHFDPAKKYPAILYCQGGPQSGVSQFWSYRWNFQMMAANDYIVVAPNRRGLPGFGTEWNEQISGDWGGQNLKDYLSAIDAVAKESFVDETRMGAVGASYGGYSVYWLAGNHNGRFNAFISHCGVFNMDMMYDTTEEMFFVNWDLGGPYWERPDNRYEFSPHSFVKNWDTPILVIHGAKDFRVPESQGMAAFNAAQMRNIPSRFLYFPEENHWVLSAQNGILWQREFAGWLNRWLKPQE
ncbi:S9 family peptidase [Alkaliflexus imshenetskii]|uniref:S9 family peptidase n=1 Tax=Alkaliflexus imshenetskii TaxID=286730 RepID=UPI00047BC8D8|nr:S9 family peptidase [Alkaliflexus imshenetskii]